MNADRAYAYSYKVVESYDVILGLSRSLRNGNEGNGVLHELNTGQRLVVCHYDIEHGLGIPLESIQPGDIVICCHPAHARRTLGINALGEWETTSFISFRAARHGWNIIIAPAPLNL